jgi:lipopolysaccharide transport system permease protein
VTQKLSAIKEVFKIPIQYRHLIWILALKELKIRYRGSAFGFFWSILNPLLLLLIYVFVFTVIFKASAKAYPVYLFVGLLPWNWFAGSINEATISIVSSGAFVNKSTLPSELLVIVKVVSNFINYALSLPVLLLFIFIFGVSIGLPLIVFPVIVIIQFFITCGIGFFVATWEVYYRDMQHIVMNLLQFLFFGMPIMYFEQQLPLKAQKLIFLNPLAYLIKSYQSIFYYNYFPKPFYLALLSLVAVVVYILGFLYFRAHKEEFPELV